LNKRRANPDASFFRKSQIAHEYAQRQSTERSVFWVRANTAENIELGYVAIARLLLPDSQHATLADCLTAVKGHLEDANTPPWLLVLDEADHKETFSGNSNDIKLAEYIPMASHGRVLITTRDSRVAGLCSGQVVLAQNGIRIGPMDFEDSFCLFQKCMRQDQLLDVSKDRCRSLLNILGGLPLAIVQAASYMREEETSVEDFVALYKDIELHGKLFQESAITTDLEQKSVLYTWELSYKRIAGPLYPESKSHAAILLDVLAFLDAEDSPFRHLNEIEYRMKDWAEPTITPSDVLVLKPYFQSQRSPLNLLESIYNRQFTPHKTFRSEIGRLCHYSLIGSRDCWVHPVVHSWIYRRLPLQEICKYISWVTAELTNHVPLIGSDGWEKYVIPTDSFIILAPKDLGILRHVNIVLRYALSPLVNEYMKINHITISDIGDLLHRFGLISVYSGKVSEGIGFIQQSILITESCDQNEASLNERKLCLAQARSHLYPREQVIAEARLCHDETSSLEAEYWVAQCLRENGQLQDALAVLRNIINTNPITYPQQFEKNQVRFMATVNAALTLVDLGDDESKTQARHLIDKRILPFLEKTPIGHVLNTITYPQILICRIEAFSDKKDLKAVCKAVVDFDSRFGTSANPSDWLRFLENLEQKGKLQEIVALAKTFTRRRPPIPDYMVFLLEHPDKADCINEQVTGWCDTYKFLGTAYFALGKFQKAEAAHRDALGLHLLLLSAESGSHLFRTNLMNLIKALRCQGDIRIQKLEKSQISLDSFLDEIAYDQVSSDHIRQGGNKLIFNCDNEEAERFSSPEAIVSMKTI
jgi:tetratricopeptide (TPR) repeat protein